MMVNFKGKCFFYILVIIFYSTEIAYGNSKIKEDYNASRKSSKYELLVEYHPIKIQQIESSLNTYGLELNNTYLLSEKFQIGTILLPDNRINFWTELLKHLKGLKLIKTNQNDKVIRELDLSRIVEPQSAHFVIMVKEEEEYPVFSSSYGCKLQSLVESGDLSYIPIGYVPRLPEKKTIDVFSYFEIDDIEKFIKQKYRNCDHGVPIKKEEALIEYLISNIRGEIIKGSNRWERIQIAVAFYKNGFVLVLDGKSAPASKSPPPNDSYDEMESNQNYKVQMQIYAQQLRTELQEYLKKIIKKRLQEKIKKDSEERKDENQ